MYNQSQDINKCTLCGTLLLLNILIRLFSGRLGHYQHLHLFMTSSESAMMTAARLCAHLLVL